MISLTCALLATLLQQWARRYLRITNPRSSLRRRARIRAYFAEGVERLRIPWTVEALPTLLHMSLFFFFIGLAVFLFSRNQAVFSLVIVWVVLCIIAYAYVTALPIIHKDSLYYAPLSTLVWFCATSVRNAFFTAPKSSSRRRTTIPEPFPTHDLEEDRLRSPFPHSLLRTAEECADRQPADIDYRALLWTFDSLKNDREIEQFFEGVPGFCSSNVLYNPVEGFIIPNSRKLSNSLIGLMDRTLSSSLVSESEKQRRITICTKVMNVANLFGPWWILPRVLLGEWQAFLRSIDFGLFLKDWNKISLPITIYYAQCAIALIISSVQTQARDDRWIQLVTRQIDVSKSVLQRYLAHGDSVLLANLVYIVRQTVQISSDEGENSEAFIKDASSRTLESLSTLDVQESLPELQRDFCNLWDQLIQAAEHDNHTYVRKLSVATLKSIRKVYVASHEDSYPAPTEFATIDDSDAALDNIASYPRCTDKRHKDQPRVFLPAAVTPRSPVTQLYPPPDPSATQLPTRWRP